METIVFAVFASAFAALVLALSSTVAVMVRRVPDRTAITPAPLAAVATGQAVKRRIAVTEITDTAD